MRNEFGENLVCGVRCARAICPLFLPPLPTFFSLCPLLLFVFHSLFPSLSLSLSRARAFQSLSSSLVPNHTSEAGICSEGFSAYIPLPLYLQAPTPTMHSPIHEMPCREWKNQFIKMENLIRKVHDKFCYFIFHPKCKTQRQNRMHAFTATPRRGFFFV